MYGLITVKREFIIFQHRNPSKNQSPLKLKFTKFSPRNLRNSPQRPTSNCNSHYLRNQNPLLLTPSTFLSLKFPNSRLKLPLSSSRRPKSYPNWKIKSATTSPWWLRPRVRTKLTHPKLLPSKTTWRTLPSPPTRGKKASIYSSQWISNSKKKPGC